MAGTELNEDALKESHEHLLSYRNSEERCLGSAHGRTCTQTNTNHACI